MSDSVRKSWLAVMILLCVFTVSCNTTPTTYAPINQPFQIFTDVLTNTNAPSSTYISTATPSSTLSSSIAPSASPSEMPQLPSSKNFPINEYVISSANDIYYTNEDGIYRYDLKSKKTTRIRELSFDITQIFIDNENELYYTKSIYYMDGFYTRARYELYKYQENGKDILISDAFVKAVRVDENYVYFIDDKYMLKIYSIASSQIVKKIDLSIDIDSILMSDVDNKCLLFEKNSQLYAYCYETNEIYSIYNKCSDDVSEYMISDDGQNVIKYSMNEAAPTKLEIYNISNHSFKSIILPVKYDDVVSFLIINNYLYIIDIDADKNANRMMKYDVNSGKEIFTKKLNYVHHSYFYQNKWYILRSDILVNKEWQGYNTKNRKISVFDTRTDTVKDLKNIKEDLCTVEGWKPVFIIESGYLWLYGYVSESYIYIVKYKIQ